MHENEHFSAEWQGIKKLTYLMKKVKKPLKGKNILQDRDISFNHTEVASIQV